tara:strand:+ start:902 stop:1081 length:180 start_codon:yes stop_codon:yes gene_type:complete
MQHTIHTVDFRTSELHIILRALAAANDDNDSNSDACTARTWIAQRILNTIEQADKEDLL